MSQQLLTIVTENGDEKKTLNQHSLCFGLLGLVTAAFLRLEYQKSSRKSSVYNLVALPSDLRHSSRAREMPS